MQNQIERVSTALLAVLFGLFVWGCSGKETNGNGSVAHGSTTQIDENGGAITGTGGQGGNKPTAGALPETGGSDSAGGNQPAGGNAGEAGSVEETGGSVGAAGAPTETGGNEPTAGSVSETGGNESTGGNQETGGNEPTGGDESTGGLEETGGTAGTGGDSETGGSTGEAGSPTGGTGGTEPVCAETGNACERSEDCCSEACYRNTCVDEMPKPHSCSKWTRSENFLEGMDITSRGCSNGSDDTFVATGTYGNAAIAHFNGSEWGLEPLDGLAEAQYSRIDGMFCTGEDAWAVGMFTIGASTSDRALIMHLVDDAWVVDTDFANALPKWSVVSSIWGANGTLYASVNVSTPDGTGGSTRDARIYVNVEGSGWSAMTVPEQDGSVFLKQVWGYSDDDVFVVGAKLPSNNYVDAVLWHFNGNVWSDWSDTIADDVVLLGAIHGNNVGEIFLGGMSTDGGNHGVVLSSMDGEVWSSDSFSMNSVSAVYSPALGAAIASGTMVETSSGSARTTTSSLGEWSVEQSFDGIAMAVTGIIQIPNTTEVLQATYGKFMGEATVYSANCQ